MTKARDIASAAPAPSTVSATEIGYLDGVTSAIQTQIDSKIGSASAINPTIVDAKGDLLVGSAADTVARLAVGTNNHVLTADSSATNGVKWAAPAGGGGITLISSTSLNGTGRTTDLTDIPGTYQDLILVIEDASWSTYDSNIDIRPNQSTSSTYVRVNNINGTTSTIGLSQSINNATETSNMAAGNANNIQVYRFSNYASSAMYKAFFGYGYYETSNPASFHLAGAWKSRDAITNIRLYNGQDVTYTNGNVLLYGVK